MAKFGIALGSGPRGLGFESRHSDQKMWEWLVPFPYFLSSCGIRKGGTSLWTGATKCPVDTWLARGRIHYSIDAPLEGVDMELFYIVMTCITAERRFLLFTNGENSIIILMQNKT